MNNIDLIYEAYKNYQWNQPKSFPAEPDSNLTQEEFVNKIKTDEVFSKRWGITVETGELSQRERCKLLYKSWEQNGISPEHKEVSTLWVEYNNLMKKYNIPTKLTTINYNGQIQEIYE
jgi:hypothetical protein